MKSDAGFSKPECDAPEARSGERALHSASQPGEVPPARHPASSPDGASSGELVDGRYRLIKRLAEGGMGTVWLAHDATLDVDVALKLLRSELAHPQLEDRLLTEARAAARLNHPAIVRVSDFGRTKAGDPYIVMELLEGEDLGHWLERERCAPPEVVLPLLLPVIHAIAVVYEKGIVHRDLKPENIVLARTGADRIQPKVVDFGIAKLEASGAERVTHAGTALGSPAYMSPEQARGLEVDARSDIWAMSVVLYEVLTGELPFTGNNHNALLFKIMGEEPRPLAHFAVGDTALWTIVSRGLAKDPAQRWQSMRELGAALSAWLLANGVREDVCGTALEGAWPEPLSSAEPEPRRPGSAPPASPSAAPAPALETPTSSAPERSRPRLPRWATAGLVLLVSSSGLMLGSSLRSSPGAAGDRPQPAAMTSPDLAPTPAPSTIPGEPRVEPVLSPALAGLGREPSTPSASAAPSSARRAAAPRPTYHRRRPAQRAATPESRPRVEVDEFDLKTRL